MQPSQSLTTALKAIEEIFEAQTSDLRELAELAADATGRPIQSVLNRIDLGGLDLRGRDISFLLDANPRYGGATLTDAQRLMFDRATRKNNSNRSRRTIHSIRTELITQFISDFEESRSPILALTDEAILTAQLLQSVLLDLRIEPHYSRSECDDRYLSRVLEALIPWATEASERFFSSLFGLLGKLQCNVGPLTLAGIRSSYFQAFPESLGALIAAFGQNRALDTYWAGEVRSAKNIIQRVHQICSVRPIHPDAVEISVDMLRTARERIEVLSVAEFHCSTDQAERIAARISNAPWQASETSAFLRARVNSKVGGAIFRQVLQQGDEDRVIELLRWLEGNRGALGTLTLETALEKIEDFSTVLRFAQEMAQRVQSGQRSVLLQALRRLATSDLDRQKLAEFADRLNRQRIDSRS